jgi:hypothetical protein
MRAFFSKAYDKASDALDSLQDYAAGAVVTYLEPKVHTEIDTRVDGFRDSSLDQLPRSCEESLKEQSEPSNVAWLFNKVRRHPRTCHRHGVSQY